MNVVDSSGWLEYFAAGKNAKHFAIPLEDPKRLIVPSLCLFEVFKRLLQQKGENCALQGVSVMQHGQIIPLDATLALAAAKLSFSLKLPMADSIILATARLYKAQIWTQDADFKDLPDVKYFAVI
ncbi:MAG: type II toxin-antitoxin system VapC family toxin [Candidatus Omnitrophica bacterium]|nr:type II toxin-antitoxin system VapC family toxin [Candidatus Omnitrophota bacterium]